MSKGVEALLEFWFGTDADQAAAAHAQQTLWWGGAGDADRLIAERFGDLHRRAIDGELGTWLQTPRGRLASIILIDQFSRSLFRARPEAFAHDALSRSWCLEGIAQMADRELRPIERVFFYLPLEHSESREDQAHSVALYESLSLEVPAELKELFEYFAGFARTHRDVVERFGRFPHRNAILGRSSTAEELAFLEQPGSSF